MKFTKKDYQKIRKRVYTISKRAPKRNFVYPHIGYTEKWLLRLKPDADFALRLAALMHDIDRAFIKNRSKNEQTLVEYKNYKLNHAQKAVIAVKHILKQFRAPLDIRKEVLYLVGNHEKKPRKKGIHNSNGLQVLIDADALAFFEDLNKYADCWGAKATQDKIAYSWMRLSSKAKKLAFVRFSKEIKSLGFKVPSKV